MDGHFTFGGLKSSDYNVWIKGGGTYGAASRRFTTEIVPGRNGELTIDDGVFEEKEHPYEAFIGENFPANIDGFRNELMSLTGRQILMDTYHPDEFYLARYMRGLEPDVLTLARAGSFTVTFSRDPRRFLTSGNAAVDTPQYDTSTVTAAMVSHFDKYGLTGVSVVGGTGSTITKCGKNIFDNDNAEWVNDYTINSSGVETSSTGYRYTNAYQRVKEETKYAGQINVMSTNARSFMVAYYDSAKTFIDREIIVSYSLINASTGVKSGTFTTPTGCAYIRLVSPKSGMADIQIEQGGIETDYVAYSATTYEEAATFTAPVGWTNLWADTGDITVTFYNPVMFNNPTYFASSPKIRVYGQGTLYINGDSITVAGSYPYVDIDTETVDADYNGVNANSVVTFAGNVPSFAPGTNYVRWTGFTAVQITPRWWKL